MFGVVLRRSTWYTALVTNPCQKGGGGAVLKPPRPAHSRRRPQPPRSPSEPEPNGNAARRCTRAESKTILLHFLAFIEVRAESTKLKALCVLLAARSRPLLSSVPLPPAVVVADDAPAAHARGVGWGGVGCGRAGRGAWHRDRRTGNEQRNSPPPPKKKKRHSRHQSAPITGTPVEEKDDWRACSGAPTPPIIMPPPPPPPPPRLPMPHCCCCCCCCCC